MLEPLYADIASIETRAHAVGSKLAGLIRRRLWNCYIESSRQTHLSWRTTRLTSDLQQVEDYLERANAILPNTPEYFVEKAICEFVLHKDLAAAEQAITRLSKMVPDDATWRYSLAFIYAYQGKLQAAWKLYRQAFKAVEQAQTPNEIEEFMTWVLETEPDKVQLYYCLGVINMESKGDLEQALRDFEMFLEKCPASRSIENRKAASKYIGDIRTRLASRGN